MSRLSHAVPHSKARELPGYRSTVGSWRFKPSDPSASRIGRSLIAQQEPERVDRAGEYAEKRQQDVQEELEPDSLRQENGDRRQEQGEQDLDDFGHARSAQDG